MLIPQEQQLKELLDTTDIVPEVTCRVQCIHLWEGLSWQNKTSDFMFLKRERTAL